MPDDRRGSVRATVASLATRLHRHYTDLLAAEAAIAARRVYPDTTRLVFTLTDDATGPSAMLIAAYNSAGRRLWHIDHDGEWPDESDVTDKLTAASHWCRADVFPAVEDTGHCEYQLPTPATVSARREAQR